MITALLSYITWQYLVLVNHASCISSTANVVCLWPGPHGAGSEDEAVSDVQESTGGEQDETT